MKVNYIKHKFYDSLNLWFSKLTNHCSRQQINCIRSHLHLKKERHSQYYDELLGSTQLAVWLHCRFWLYFLFIFWRWNSIHLERFSFVSKMKLNLPILINVWSSENLLKQRMPPLSPSPLLRISFEIINFHEIISWFRMKYWLSSSAFALILYSHFSFTLLFVLPFSGWQMLLSPNCIHKISRMNLFVIAKSTQYNGHMNKKLLPKESTVKITVAFPLNVCVSECFSNQRLIWCCHVKRAR